MRPEIEGLHVWYTEVSFAAHLHLTHLKFVFNGGPWHTEIFLIKLFNWDNYKLCESLTATQSFEGVLPVIGRVDFVCSHGMNVNNVNGSGDLIDQDNWPDST